MVVPDIFSPGEKKREIQDKLICLDCGEEVEFSPTIFIPDSFMLSLHNNKKKRGHLSMDI